MFTHPRKIEILKREITRTQLLVVAGDAVLAEGGLKKFGCRCRLRLRDDSERVGEK